MSYEQVLAALKAMKVPARDNSGKFSSGGHEGPPPPEGETEEDRKRKAEKLRLAAEQNKRKAALEARQSARRDIPEAKI